MKIYARAINDAVKASVDAGKLAEAWQALHPRDVAKAAKAMNPVLSAFLAAARDAVVRALMAVLPRAWTEGWVLGQLAANAVVQGLEQADWAGWTPGDHKAAEAVAGDGLRQLLAEAGVRISSIADTRLGELAAVLEQTLASDIVYREMDEPVPVTLSVGSLTRQLESALDNPARAGLVAQTEIARAQSAASMALYRETGTDRVEWSTAMDAKVCPLCDANEAAGSWPTGEAFPSGAVMPPQHPRCRCALLPAMAVPA